MIHLCRRQDEDISTVDDDLYRGSSDEGEIDCDVTTQTSEEEEDEEELMRAMTRGPSREPSETADDLSVRRRTPQDLGSNLEDGDSRENAKISDDCVSTTTPVDDAGARGGDGRGSKSTSEDASSPNVLNYSYYSDELETPGHARTAGDVLDVQTVPIEIQVSEAGRSVCARSSIPKGTRYGPFLGKWLLRPIDPRFAWGILIPGKKVQEYLDGTLEPTNWMKFVRSTTGNDQNLRHIVLAGQIYYEAIQDICETDELLIGPKKPILLDVFGESAISNENENENESEADGVSQHSCPSAVKKEDIKEEEVEPRCTICDKVFSSLELLGEHLVKVHKYPCGHVECKRCPKALFWRPDLLRHRHGNVKRYPCENCSKVFTDASNLQRHIRIHHVGARSHACPECGKTFSASSGLKQHMHIHSSFKPFKCKVCFKSYTQFSNLCRHRRMHASCRLYIKCKTCGQHFNSSSSHSKHRRFCEPTSATTSGTMALPISQSSPTTNMPATTPSNPLLILPRPHLPFYPSSLLGPYPSLFPSNSQQPAAPFMSSPLLFPPAPNVKLEESSHKMMDAPSDYQPRISDQRKWFYDEDRSPSPVDRKTRPSSDPAPGKEARVTPPPASAFKAKASPSAAEEAASLERPSPARPSVGGATCTYSNPRELLKSENKDQKFKEEIEETKPSSPILEGGKEQPLDLRVTRKRKITLAEETVLEERTPSPKVSSPAEPKRPKSRTPSPVPKEPVALEPKSNREPSPVPAGSASSPPTMAYPRPIHPMLLEAMYRPSGFPQNFPPQNGRLLGHPPPHPPPYGPPRAFSFLGSLMNGLPNGQSSQRSFDLLRNPLSGFAGVKPYQDVLTSHIGNGGPAKMKDRYGCTYCGKIFPRSANLTRHVRTHTGEQPYKCQYCERSFSISSNLQRHVRNIHNKEKPFKCPSCERCFGQQTNLDRHLKKHEADDGTGSAPVADSPESNGNERQDACFDEIRSFMGKVACTAETVPQTYANHSYGSPRLAQEAKEGEESENRSPGPDFPESRGSASSKNYRLLLPYDVNVKAEQEALNNNGPDHEAIEAAA